MIENYLRQLTTVRSRITAGNLALVVLFVLLVPLIISSQSYLSGRLQEVTRVEVRTDRLLLQASANISSSRTNLSRYIQQLTPSPNAALEDTAETIGLMEEAAALAIDSEHAQSFEAILADLNEYQVLINAIDANRQSGEGQMVQLEVQALQLGSDLGVRLDQQIQQSASRVDAAQQAIFSRARTGLFVLLFGFLVILFISFFLARAIQQSITRPIAALQEGAEQFRQGNWEVTVPVSGSDELTLLAATFNQMAGDLVNSQTFLEERIAQRTRSLEMSAQISHNLSSILDQNAFSVAVVDQIQATFGYYFVQLYLVGETNDRLILKSATGLAGQKMLIRGHHLQIGKGIVGKAAATKEVVVAPDVSQNSDWLDNPLLPETRCEAAVPIISRGAVLGVLDIQHNVVDSIREEDVNLLRSISNQVAIALENSKLFVQLQRQAAQEALLNQLTQKIQLASSVDQVLQITAQELGKALNADFTSVKIGKQIQPANGHEKVG